SRGSRSSSSETPGLHPELLQVTKAVFPSVDTATSWGLPSKGTVATTFIVSGSAIWSACSPRPWIVINSTGESVCAVGGDVVNEVAVFAELHEIPARVLSVKA